jgi:hypothetical protein
MYPKFRTIANVLDVPKTFANVIGNAVTFASVLALSWKPKHVPAVCDPKCVPAACPA